MCEQMTIQMGPVPKKEPKSSPMEKQVYEQILPSFLSVLEADRLTIGLLTVKPQAEFTSLLCCNEMFCRLCFRKKNAYISVRKLDLEKLPPSLECMRPRKNDEYTRVKMPDTASILLMTPILADKVSSILKSVHKEFDCCSRFEACSDAKQCVHPDWDHSILCGYKRILKEGRIFFGQNRNID